MTRPKDKGKSRSMGRDRLFTTLLVAILGAAMLAGGYRVIQLVQQGRALRHNIPASIEEYGFDLSQLQVPRESLAPRMYKDEFKPYQYEKLYTPEEVEEYNRTEHGKLVVPTDRVIGVVDTQGNARAYPLRFLAWHEVCNDELGGRPICVTYCGLTDSAQVFDALAIPKSSGKGKAELQPPLLVAVPLIGNSGMAVNSNTVLYELKAEPLANSALWRQLDGRQINLEGQVANLRQVHTSSMVCLWRDWLALHPGSQVGGHDPSRLQDYKTDAFGPYFQTPRLVLPATPLPDREFLAKSGLTLKSRCLAFQPGVGKLQLIPFEAIREFGRPVSGNAGLYQLQVPDCDAFVDFYYRGAEIGFAPETAWGPAGCTQALFFAWHANLGPDAYEIFGGPEQK